MTAENPSKDRPYEWIPPEAAPVSCLYCGKHYARVSWGPVFHHRDPDGFGHGFGANFCGTFEPPASVEPEAHGSLKGLK